MKALLVGCGTWGRNIARVVHASGHLAAIADSNGEPDATSESPAAAWRSCRFYASLEEALAAVASLKVALIATPDHTHGALARQALRAGLDVFVEKPLAMGLDELNELQKQAGSSQILMAGHLLRFHPAFEALQGALERIGPLRRIESIRHDQQPRPRDTDLLWGYGPHDMALMVGLMSATDPSLLETPPHLEPGRATGSRSTRCLWENAWKGIELRVDLSWISPRRRVLTVIGRDGELVWAEGQTPALSYRSFRNPTIHPIEFASREPLRAELAHFFHAVATRTPPLTSGAEPRWVTALVENFDQALVSSASASA